jgi:uncharacterized damage-inducible protein DinB
MVRTREMSALEDIRFWYIYNSHVRKGYLRAILSPPREEALRDRGASHPSILDIFVHVLDGYRYWFFVVVKEGGAESGFSRWVGSLRLEDLREKEKEVDTRVMASMASLVEDDLSTEIGRGPFELRDLLRHMVEEELQHRGGLNALLWQMNVSPPLSDAEDARYIKMHVAGERCPRCAA